MYLVSVPECFDAELQRKLQHGQLPNHNVQAEALPGTQF